MSGKPFIWTSVLPGSGLCVSVCYVTYLHMQYFKPAAAIIILIFVLALIYEGTTNGMDENKRQTALETQKMNESARQNNYTQCVEKAESNKEKTARVGRTELALQQSSGRHEAMVDTCIANNPLSATQYSPAQAPSRQMVRNNCEAAATESIMRSHNAMPEEIEEQYKLDLQACGVKYGQ